MFWKINYFIQDFYKKHGPFETHLDVGSRDINGTVLNCLKETRLDMPKQSTGIDFIDGQNVDVVLNGHDIESYFGQDSFDLVTCCETLEHDDEFWKTVEGIRAVTKPGGYALITVPGPYFFLHDYPGDYYRFTKQAVEKMFEGWEDVHVEEFQDPEQLKLEDAKANLSILGYGRKPK